MTANFNVWAPWPKKVELQLGPERFPMRSDGHGEWTASIPNVAPGSDYGFILDGAGPFPDPRSPSQPKGIDGLSRLVDHGKFAWSNSNWQPPLLADAVIYELHTGTFTPQGTFDAIIGKLDYLRDLGVTHLELMPVNEFSGAHGWGYDGVDLYAPHHAYGGPEGLKRLVNACHERGLAILLDVVYNHLGPAGNHLAKFGPYFTPRHSSPWGEALNFDDAGSEHVRRFFCDNALMWLRDYHFDGLRLDAVHAIVDSSPVTFLQQLASEVKQLNPKLILIPESDLNDPRLLRSVERGGFGLDAQWSDDFHHALHTVLTEEKQGYYGDFGALADLSKALRNAYVYDGTYSKFRRRAHGSPPEGLNGHHFLGYSQNHDQVGNRAAGDRHSQYLSAGRLKIASAIVLTSPFIPMLFQGEEWGAKTPFQYFTDHQDRKLGDAVRKGRKQEFAAHGWNEADVPDPQARETFERSKLNWGELGQTFHADLFQWYQQLIALRRASPILRDGQMNAIEVHCNETERWVMIERGPFTIACNLADVPRTLRLRARLPRILMSSSPVEQFDNAAILAPDSVAIMKQG